MMFSPGWRGHICNSFNVTTGDLRLLLCGNATDCPHLQASEWTLTDFLQRYFRNPEMLVNNKTRVNDTKTMEEVIVEREENPPSHAQSVMEKAMWERNPWVICNKNGSNCSGTIPKADWLADRGGTCTREVVAYLDKNPGALSVEMDVCNLNAKMDSLCKALLNSVLEVGNANCLTLGVGTCMEKSFFYSPSTFSSSNQQVCVMYM